MKYLIGALRHPRDYEWLALRPIQRHSWVLAVGGLIYIALGGVLALTDPTPQRTAGLKLALVLAPLEAWGTLWIVVGALAIVSSRWPPASKTWGYSAMTGLAACWAGVYLIGVLLLDTPGSGVTGALVYALLGFMWWAIAGLVNPDDIRAHVTTIVDEIISGEIHDQHEGDQ